MGLWVIGGLLALTILFAPLASGCSARELSEMISPIVRASSVEERCLPEVVPLAAIVPGRFCAPMILNFVIS